MKMSIAFLPVSALALFAIAGNAAGQTPTPTAAAEPMPAYLQGPGRALDGSTIELNSYQVRLFGIDAPEMADARGPVARGALDDLLKGAAEVACDIVDQDRHGRPVGRCRAGGRDLSEAMVLGGWAFGYRVFTSEYDAAEAEARAEARGFWATDNKTRQVSGLVVLGNSLDVVAIYAAIVATFVLVWDIIKWARSGPRLRVSATPGMKTVNVPDPRLQSKTFVRVSATNIGSGATKLTTLAIAHYKSWWQKFCRRPELQGVIAMPSIGDTGHLPFTLSPGDEWSGFIEQSEELENWAADGYLYADVYDAVHEKPARTRIVIKLKSSSRKKQSTETN